MKMTPTVTGLIIDLGQHHNAEKRFYFSTESDFMDMVEDNTFAVDFSDPNFTDDNEAFFVEQGEEIDVSEDDMLEAHRWAIKQGILIPVDLVKDFLKNEKPLQLKSAVKPPVGVTGLSIHKKYKSTIDQNIDMVADLLIKFLQGSSLGFLGAFAPMIAPLVPMLVDNGADYLKDMVPYTDQIAQRVKRKLEYTG